MATARQIAANLRNSQKSTGPVTPEGKAKSCMNRLSHGFTSSNVFVTFEKSEDFNALLSDLVNHFQPANVVEQILVEKIAQNQWISLRAVCLQSVALKGSVPSGYIPKDLSPLMRYQAAADRGFHKAHAELLKIRKQRENSEIGFESQNADEVAEPVQNAPENPPLTGENPPFNSPNEPVLPEFVPFEMKLAEELDLNVAQSKLAA